MSEYGYDYQRKPPDGSVIENDFDNTISKSEQAESPSISAQEVSEQEIHAVSEQDFSRKGLSALQDSDTSCFPFSEDNSLNNEGVKTVEDLTLQVEKPSKEYLSSIELNDLPESNINQNIEAKPELSPSADIPVYDPKLEKETPKETREPPSGFVVKQTNESIEVNPNKKSTINFEGDLQQDNPEIDGESNSLGDLNSPSQNNDVSTSQVLIKDQKINKNEIVLENGERVITTGGVQAYKDLNHQQGEVVGFEGTCGLCSVQCVSNQFGLKNEKGEQISEEDIINLAKDENPSLCVIESNPENNGGTSQVNQQLLLGKLGIPAHVESGKSMDQLAQEVEQGKGVIAGMEATELWGENPHKGINLLPRPNHAVTVIDTARDPGTNKLKGFFINDSGNNYNNIGSGRFVSVGEMQFCWQNHSGSYVVTNGSFYNGGANSWI